MDPITLIVTALSTGASAGAVEALKDDAREAVKASHAKLTRLARKRLIGQPDGEVALEQHGTAPQKWELTLADELTKAAAASDSGLIAAAKALMELADQADTRIGKYNVTVKNSEGVLIGDGNIQVNSFRTRPGRSASPDTPAARRVK